MNCLDFFEGHLSERIADAQDDDSPVLFLHVPKTGGTSAERDLNFAVPDSLHIPINSEPVLWEQALSQISERSVSLVRGHLDYQQLQQAQQAAPDLRAVTYLRHPTQRLLSNYLWRVMRSRQEPDQFESPGSFPEFCEKRASNVMTAQLIGQCDSTEEALNRIQRNFWFVGLTEFYHVCQAVLIAALGSTYRMRQRHNITTNEQADFEGITETEIRYAESKMQIDFAVYNHFVHKWTLVSNNAVELLMKVKVDGGMGIKKAA